MFTICNFEPITPAFFFGAELSPLGNQKKKHQMGTQKIQCNSYRGFFVKRIAPMLPDVEEFFL